MAQLVVSNLPVDLVRALARRAARANRTVEEEHREILLSALQIKHRTTFAQLLVAMPNVGEDEDFARSH